MLSESSLSALFPPTSHSPPLQDSAGTVQLTNSGGQTSVPIHLYEYVPIHLYEYMQFMIDSTSMFALKHKIHAMVIENCVYLQVHLIYIHKLHCLSSNSYTFHLSSPQTAPRILHPLSSTLHISARAVPHIRQTEQSLVTAVYDL